jgi:hypothetical protein
LEWQEQNLGPSRWNPSKSRGSNLTAMSRLLRQAATRPLLRAWRMTTGLWLVNSSKLPGIGLSVVNPSSPAAAPRSSTNGDSPLPQCHFALWVVSHAISKPLRIFPGFPRHQISSLAAAKLGHGACLLICLGILLLCLLGRHAV